MNFKTEKKKQHIKLRLKRHTYYIINLLFSYFKHEQQPVGSIPAEMLTSAACGLPDLTEEPRTHTRMPGFR